MMGRRAMSDGNDRRNKSTFWQRSKTLAFLGHNRLRNLAGNRRSLVKAILAALVLIRFFPGAIPYLKPFGELYIRLVQMTIIPLAVSATIANMSPLLRSHKGDRLFRRFTLAFIAIFLVVFLIASVVGLLGENVMRLSPSGRTAVGERMFKQAVSGSPVDNWSVFSGGRGDGVGVQNPDATFTISIPSNVYRSFRDGNMIHIVFVSILFAVMMSKLPQSTHDTLKNMFDGVFSVFMRILDAIYFFAAPGVACYIAGQLGNMNLRVIWEFRGVILLSSATLVGLTVIGLAVTCRRAGIPWREAVSGLRESMLVAFAVGNARLAMPNLLTGMTALGFKSRVVSACAPLAVNISCFGEAALFVVGGLFCAHIYGAPMGAHFFLILLGTVPLASLATVGAAPLVWYGYLALCLEPVGIPAQPVLMIFFIADPILSRVLALTSISMASTLTAVTHPTRAAEAAKGEELPQAQGAAE